MEKKRQNIDNFFKENLSGFELPKKEGNWELLNHLLNEQEKKKKKRRWFFLIFCFLIITTSGLLLFLAEKKPAENNSAAILQSNESHPADNNSLKNIPGKSITTIPSVKNEVERDAKNNAEEIKPGNNSLINQKVNPSKIVAVKKETAHSIDQENTTDVSVINHTGINSSAQPPPVILHNDSSQTGVDQADHAVSPVANQSQLEDSATSNSTPQQITNTTESSTDSLIIKSVSNDSLIAETKNDSIPDSSAKAAPAKKNILNINIYIGANIYSTSSAFTDHENISPVAGVEFAHSFSSKFSVGLAGLYSMQGGYHLDDTAIVSEKTYFLDVSENVSQQTIQIRQLQKLYFPLTLYYAVTAKHIVSGGVKVAYLVNTKGNYTEKNTIAGITSQSQKNNVKGYMDGIRSTNFAVSLGYRFRLSGTFDISAHVTRELKEGYIKEYFYGVHNNPAWTFQTFLIVKF